MRWYYSILQRLSCEVTRRAGRWAGTGELPFAHPPGIIGALRDRQRPAALRFLAHYSSDPKAIGSTIDYVEALLAKYPAY